MIQSKIKNILFTSASKLICFKNMTKKTSAKVNDPLYEKEKEKYSHPIPSREYILNFLKKKSFPCSFEYICEKLSLTQDKNVYLTYRLKAMLRDKQIKELKGYYCLLEWQKHHVQGNVLYDPDSGEMLVCKNNEYYHLAAIYQKCLFNGDHINISPLGYDKKGIKLYSLDDIISRSLKELWGHYYANQKEVSTFIPLLKDIPRTFIVLPHRRKVESGALVRISIVIYPTLLNPTVVKLKTVELGHSITSAMQIISQKYFLTLTEDAGIDTEVKTLESKIHSKAKNLQDLEPLRRDLTHLDFITIDSEDTQDIDDAVYAYLDKDGNAKLFVAISDVSHYVKPNTLIDESAKRHTCSVYFPNNTIHMLPLMLATDFCSLQPKSNRLVLVCEMQVDLKGEITQVDIYEAMIHSRRAVSYKEVNTILDKENLRVRGKAETRTKVKENLILERTIKNLILDLYKVYKMLSNRIDKTGKIQFQTTDSLIIFEDNLPTLVKIKKPTLADYMIEIFMISANEQVAKFITNHKLTNIYRVNLAPSPDKIQLINDLVEGLDLNKVHKLTPNPMSYNRLLKSLQKTPYYEHVALSILKTMKAAHYHTSALGHFGLDLSEYTHFTSPIRRYADLVVHRIIKNFLHQKNQLSKDYLAYICKLCSIKSRQVDHAVMEIIKFYKCKIAEKMIEQEVDVSFIQKYDHKYIFNILDLSMEGYQIRAMDCADLKLGSLFKAKIIRVDSLAFKIELSVVL